MRPAIIFRPAVLLKNGDFAVLRPDGKRPANWSGKLNDASGVRKGITPAKGNAMCFSETGHMLSQSVKVQPGKVYQISYLLKSEFSKWLSAASMQILWFDAKGKPLFVDYKGKKVWNMKIKNLVGQRFKERPADCVIDSHALMVRGGYMKYVGNGIFSEFPVLRRVTAKIERIIREEM